MSPSSVILLVDDDPHDVFFLRRALQQAGVRRPLRVVRDGEEAVHYLQGFGPYADRDRHPLPCLVLLDVKLPKRSGLEVLRWLRGRPDLKDLPALMVSSSGEPRDLEEAAAYGVEAYRVKPVAFDELVRLAREIRDEADEHCRDAQPCPEGYSGDQPPPTAL